MLQINENQFKYFGELSKIKFLEKSHIYLKEKYLHQYEKLTKKGIDHLLNYNIDVAKKNGLFQEKTILTMTEISIIYGKNYLSEQQWSANIIEYFELSEEEVNQRLRNYL